jgi:hypothetical protein
LKALDLEFEGQVKGKRDNQACLAEIHTLTHLTGQKKRNKAKKSAQAK